MRPQKVLCAALSAASGAHAAVRRATTDTFNLYAYGDGIGGLPVIANGDLAYIGDGRDLSNESAIYLTKDDDDSTTWIVKPNTTDSSGTTPFDKATLYIPGPDSTTKQVGFLEDDGDLPTGAKTDGFLTYGRFVMHKSEAGSLETLWYALATETSGLWSLNWNTTDDIGTGIPLNLKTNPPSSGAGPTPPSRL